MGLGTEAEYKTIMRTFLSVFPEATLWGGGSLMIGSKKPLALYLAGPDEMRAFVGDGPVLTDDLPLVEYFLSLPRDRGIDIRGLRGDVSSRVQLC